MSLGARVAQPPTLTDVHFLHNMLTKIVLALALSSAHAFAMLPATRSISSRSTLSPVMQFGGWFGGGGGGGGGDKTVSVKISETSWPISSLVSHLETCKSHLDHASNVRSPA